MNWKVILLLACVAISFATLKQRTEKREGQQKLERAAVQAELQAIEERFAETTGASKSWLLGAGCGDHRTPLYVVQRAIQAADKAIFNVRVDDVVLINDQLQLRANYRSVGECLFAPDISVHAWITEEQVAELNVGDAGRFDAYLLALDVSDTSPQDNGIVVAGKLIGITAREPRD